MNQTGPPDPTWLETLGTTGIVAVVGGLLVVLLTAYCTGLAKRKQERTARYGVMVATLTSWAEMPYRVRRRLSNDPTVTQPLIDRFHDLQEQLAREHSRTRSGVSLAVQAPQDGGRRDPGLHQAVHRRGMGG